MKKISEVTLEKLWFYSTLIVRPNFWTIREKYDPLVDKFINEIMDRNIEGKFKSYTVEYGDVDVWISNYPYSYGTIYSPNHNQGRASLYTVYKFKKFIDQQQLHSKITQMSNKADLLSIDRIAHKMFVEK